MAFTQNEDMVQTLPPDRADEPLHEGILPRAVGRREDFADPHALDASPKRLPVDAVAIAEEVGRRGVVRERVDELLGGPGGGGMRGDIEVDDAPAMVVEHDVRQVCDGGERRFESNRETVRSATSRPGLSNSPWIRGAPQSGLAACPSPKPRP